MILLRPGSDNVETLIREAFTNPPHDVPLSVSSPGFQEGVWPWNDADKCLSTFMDHLRRLGVAPKRLSFPCNLLGDKSASVLGSFFEAFPQKVELLDLQGCRMTENGLATLTEAVARAGGQLVLKLGLEEGAAGNGSDGIPLRRKPVYKSEAQ